MPTYDQEVLADAPRGYWKLGESSGNFQDSSGNANHSTGTAGTVTRDQASILPGGVGRSVYIVTYGSYISLPTAIADWSLALSLEFWLKKNSGPGYGNIVGKNQDSNNYAFIVYSGATNSNFGSCSIKPSNTGNSTATALATGQTYHIVVTCTSGTNPTITWYVNGVRSAGSVVTTARNNTGSHRIGSMPDSFWGCMDGWIQNYACYNTVLDANRVLAHYAAAARVGVVI